ncbi:MAG: class I SAM-dependent methyltransferase [Chlamydiia bacterium]|nr:class I SAM-dependent methyltransferase [Chlamydiia bacterium]MCB1114978.1 class I SAM-dependent methyltransferase [Chlamydiia bacterium]
MQTYDHPKTFTKTPIEAVKSFWNNRPCNLRHSTQEIGSKKYFEEIEARKFFVEPHLLELADFQSAKGKKVLEIGCGLGVCSINFAKAGASVTAVDLSQKSIDIAKKNATAVGVDDKIQFFQGNAESLSEMIPQEKYDIIFSFGVIHHSPHPEKIIQEAKKFLKPNGTFKVMVYHRYSWKVLWILFRYGKMQFWKLSDLIAKYSEAQTGCPITYSYSRKELRKLFEKNGYQLNSLWADHIFPYKISEYVKYRYIKVWYFRFLPRPLFRLLEKAFGWTLCLSATLKNS